MENDPGGRICEQCRDVVFYCTCFIGKDRELSDSGQFQISDGKAHVLWSPVTRTLSGDKEIKAKILGELSGNEETICDVGTLWMEEREPIAVAFVAELLGYDLSGHVPEWGYSRE